MDFFMKNYYEILEVNKKASKEVIDKAYKVLAKKYHPDLYSSVEKQTNEMKLKELNEAYRVLSDDFLKAQYDKELEIQERDEIIRQYEKKETVQETEQPTQTYKKNRRKQVSTKEHKIGTLGSLMDLTKEIVDNRPQIKEKRGITKKDVYAVILTIIVVLILGVILWFIPFTNGWMRELLFENPLFSWMF